MIKGIIFDFDGVIVESIQVKTDAFANMYNKYGKSVINKVVNHHESNGGMSRYEKIKYYHNNFLNKEITSKEIQELSDSFSKIVVDGVITSAYVQGVLDFIKKNKKNYKYYISTGTPTDEILHILDKRKISSYFTDVYGSPEKKHIHIKKIINDYEYNKSELLFIGDSPTDYNASIDCGINFILRLNDHNKHLFNGYKGKKIYNFSSLKI